MNQRFGGGFAWRTEANARTEAPRSRFPIKQIVCGSDEWTRAEPITNPVTPWSHIHTHTYITRGGTPDDFRALFVPILLTLSDRRARSLRGARKAVVVASVTFIFIACHFGWIMSRAVQTKNTSAVRFFHQRFRVLFTLKNTQNHSRFAQRYGRIYIGGNTHFKSDTLPIFINSSIEYRLLYRVIVLPNRILALYQYNAKGRRDALWFDQPKSVNARIALPPRRIIYWWQPMHILCMRPWPHRNPSSYSAGFHLRFIQHPAMRARLRQVSRASRRAQSFPPSPHAHTHNPPTAPRKNIIHSNTRRCARPIHKS